MSFGWGLVAVLGLAALSVITRGFFFISDRQLPTPEWLMQSLRYAPLAALVAVIAPDLVMSNGQVIDTWQDARLFAATAGLAFFFWKRDILGTILVGMAVLLPLKLWAGW